ncbi:hypothetical protein A5886_002836 [Enterococcus sp. 8G7_MSG3316]|uniref:PASTA domain-containing protein n=1 Tax=Candidatus Enterococcus testudinis TaxID=1834191 RepID=A0A242A9M3_9ENTE|nr:PASTA domain-containing protein [Enterococcus sp. 8G7_MSG3316]OTN77735.1 hypothetical protein A5886_002836 [Enterococcus sp. 8G7_MSG3316]
MSDFLSNFSPDKYDGKKQEPTPTPQEKTEPPAQDPAGTAKPVVESTPETTGSRRENKQNNRQAKDDSQLDTNKQSVSRFGQEETEFDPTYKNKKRKKIILITTLSLLLAVVIGVVYYQLTHVKVPDFKATNLAEARTWGNEEGVTIKVEQAYDFEMETNQIIDQDVAADKKIKKGATLTLTASLGPDPEEQLALPDFADMETEAAKQWIEDNKAENISLIEQFDDTVKANAFIKQEANNKELDLTAYRRKDRLSVYYSKGKEVFEKDIEVTDFTGKTKAEAAEWAKKNELTYKEETVFSDSVAVDLVVSQEPVKGSKLAKKDTFLVKVSKGEAMTVPDFSQYTIEEAQGLESKIPIQVSTIYATNVSYGSFISQSVESGKEYGEGDTLPTVQVVYSLGQPYLKDIRFQATEGDLPKLFFDEYKSKGAYVYYDIYYVDSAEPKGTVVEMSRYGEFIPLETWITIGISRGNLQGAATNVPEETPTETPVETPVEEADSLDSAE